MRTFYRGLFFRYLSLFLFRAASFHLGARDIAFFVNEIEVSLFLLDTAFCYLFGATSFFLASGHLGARDIAFFVYEVEVTFLPLDPNLAYFLCHILFHLPPCYYF